MKNIFTIVVISFYVFTSGAQEKKELLGKWDLNVVKDGSIFPSWVEIKLSGVETYVGRFVSVTGSARPISEIYIDGKKFSFEIPPQWDPEYGNLKVSGELVEGKLSGHINYTNGEKYSYSGVPAPYWPNVKDINWGKPIALFNGKNLEGWNQSGKKLWAIESGVLTCPGAAANLISKSSFSDFKINAEFRIPKGSNSGIYLRGRYEVQIEDSYGKEPSNIFFGGVYGFLTPNQMAAKKAGEWQSYEITLIGNKVSIVANGILIISNQIIPGITGGALNSNEGEPGPIMLQGDHGSVEFRKFTITPVSN